MTVMNDRSQGGSVIEDGTIELTHHRRLLVYDDRGVESLKSTLKSLGTKAITQVRFTMVASLRMQNIMTKYSIPIQLLRYSGELNS